MNFANTYGDLNLSKKKRVEKRIKWLNEIWNNFWAKIKAKESKVKNESKKNSFLEFKSLQLQLTI